MTTEIAESAPRRAARHHAARRGGTPRPAAARLIVPGSAVLATLAVGASAAGVAEVTGPTAYAGSFLLVATLLPSNLLRFARWAGSGRLRALARLRKPLGIGSGIWFVAHAAAGLLEYVDLGAPLQAQLLTGDMLLGLAALAVFAALLATSNAKAQKAMGGNWKRLQRLVWFAVPLALAHGILSALRLSGEIEPPGVLPWVWIILFAAAEYVAQRRRAGAATHLRLVGAGVAAALLLVAVA